MKTFTLANKAKDDLVGIARYTEAQWGKEQRNLYLRQFDDAFHLLVDTPVAGKSCDYIKEGYRKFPQGSDIIFYREPSETNLQIVRILHKHMDVESQLSKP